MPEPDEGPRGDGRGRNHKGAPGSSHQSRDRQGATSSPDQSRDRQGATTSSDQSRDRQGATTSADQSRDRQGATIHGSARIDEAQVRHVAKLSRLTLSDAEVAAFSGQLSHILGYFEQIRSLNTDGVEPLAHPLPLTDVLREDAPAASLAADEALAAAPAREGDFFRVPRVLDHGGA